jgi:polyphenol oxidase
MTSFASGIDLGVDFTAPFNLSRQLQVNIFPSTEQAHSWSKKGFPNGIQLLKQVHGPLILSHFDALKDNVADGHWADFDAQKPVALGIYTADCLAVCFAWGDVGMIVHAGWKGLAAGILDKAFHFFDLPPDRILIGPAIFGDSYECGLEVGTALQQAGCGNIPVTENKCFPDLQILASQLFLKWGIKPQKISVARANTYTNPLLCSYRRACHLGEPNLGRIVTVLSNHKSSC